jgi:Transcriptional regulators
MNKNKFTMVPIKRTDIFQTIVKKLNELLDSGQLQIGDRLPAERELAELLGVSRTSIRQALKVLEASGRIETRVGSGTYLVDKQVNASTDLVSLASNQISKEFMQQLIAARTGIERAVFEEFCHNVTKSKIRVLNQLIDEINQEEGSDTDFIEEGGLDLSFEAKVAELSGNVILVNLQQQIHQLWVKAWQAYGYVPEQKETIQNEHLAILDALAAKNITRALDLIVQHVDKEIS